MAQQYNNLKEFNAYKQRISTHIAAKLVSTPLALTGYSQEAQNSGNENYANYISQTGASTAQWFQRTIKAGEVKRNRLSNIN